jgi:uncharacterized protein
VIRVVIDPGVFISALIGSGDGPPDLVVRAFVDDRIKVLASPLLLAELELVLRRPKFAAYVDERTAHEFVERIRRRATIVDDPVERPAVTRDRKDDYLVALGRSEDVDAIVSGDRDLIDERDDAAVVARVFARAGEALRLSSERAADQEPADALGELIAGCLDFFAADPNFVHIVQREALRGGDPVRDALQGPVLDQALVGLEAIAEPLHVDSAHLLVLLASVCWFPYAHANTLPKALGLDPYATEFRVQHRRAVVELLLARMPERRRNA